MSCCQLGDEIIKQIKHGLIVSCQAYPGDPMYGSKTMGQMAVAAEIGGAVGIRANGVSDINVIRQVTDLPIIGIIKKEYNDSDVYITPTKSELEILGATDIEIIALDGTERKRPGDNQLKEMINFIKNELGKLVMADVSTMAEGVAAESFGADIIAPTLSGYTESTKDIIGPDWKLIEELVKRLHTPIIAEGKIMSEKEAVKAVEMGCHAVCVGTAITRPEAITKRFVNEMNLFKQNNSL